MASFIHTLRSHHKGDRSLEQLSKEIDCLLKDENLSATEFLAMIRDGNAEHLLPPNVMEYVNQWIEANGMHDESGECASCPGDNTVVDDGITDDGPEDDTAVDLELRGNHRGKSWEKVDRTLQRRFSNTGTMPHEVGTHQIQQVGEKLSKRFELTQYLGSGGMHRVFKARDLFERKNGVHNSVVTIKVLDPKLCKQPEWRDLVRANTLQCNRLRHPNIAETYDVFMDGLTLYTSTEYVAGESLKRIIEASNFKGMPLNKALRIIDGMGRALAYAHAHGIVHCDFKPANVILTDTGIAKVIDFGIARASYTDEQTDLQPLYKGALTPAYASPERLEHHKPDPRDDIYSLACTSYELLTGVHPFGRSRATDARNYGIQPERVISLNRRQWKALRKALDFDRATRSSTVEEFLAGINGRDKRWRSALYATSGLGVIAAITWLGVYSVMMSEAGIRPVVQRVSSTVSSLLAPANGTISNPRAAAKGPKPQVSDPLPSADAVQHSVRTKGPRPAIHSAVPGPSQQSASHDRVSGHKHVPTLESAEFSTVSTAAEPRYSESLLPKTLHPDQRILVTDKVDVEPPLSNRKIKIVQEPVEAMAPEEIPSQSNGTNAYSITSLLLSARRGDLNALVANLVAGIHPNARDPVSGSTALITAAMNGHAAVITALIQAGGDVNAKDLHNKTAVLWAAQKGHAETVQLLLDSGATETDTTLQGDNVLTLAAWGGHVPMVRMLLDRGIDVNFQNSDGWTALIISAIKGFTSLSNLLLAHGADPNIRSNDGQTALMAAAWNGHAEIVKRLCAPGCAVNARSQDGRTALHQAAWNGHRNIARILIGNGADINIKDYEGQTAERVAANQGYGDVVKLLKGAAKNK
jgi:ankyrin repeat protein/tRNA A-37 threonylcarbamoyl transferase component Bud32